MGLRHALRASIVGLCLPAVVSAQTRDPENLGVSSERLALIKPWYQAQADAGALTGAVVAIARNGKIAYLEAVGTQDRKKRVQMKTDAIFWIASMTKPITSVAAMMLVDEGKLDLAVPVYRYLPDLKDMQVGLEKVDAITGATRLVLEPPMRPMTVRDLLQHTSGLVYPEEGNTAIHNRYRWAVFRRDATLAEFVASLAKLPLAHQPGRCGSIVGALMSWRMSWRSPPANPSDRTVLACQYSFRGCRRRVRRSTVGFELGPRLCDPHRPQLQHRARRDRQLHMGRSVGHQVLD